MLSYLIAFIWSAAALVAFFTQNFTELGIVTPVMMIVVGFVFGYKAEQYHAVNNQEEK